MTDSPAVVARRKARVEKAAERARNAEEVKNRANELFKSGYYNEACNAYIVAMKVNGGPTPVLLSNLAAAYNKLDMFEWANYAAGAALEYEPRMIKARYRRAMARKRIFGYRAAQTDLEGVLTIDPENQETKIELKAVQALIRAEGGFPESPSDTYPRINDEPWDLYYDSDSEDCKHEGNKVPCRFYNHQGCNQGNKCKYSHAPDNKSVRDELGKNVCTKFLLGACTYGADKCVYSHSKEYLPLNGWWNNPSEVVAAKKIYPLINNTIPSYGDFRDILIENPKARRFAARVECQSVLAGEVLMWPEADAIFEKHRHAAVAHAQNVSPLAVDPLVIVLAFEYDDVFDNILSHLYSALEDKAMTMHIRSCNNVTVQQAIRALDAPNIAAVFIADAGIVKKKCAKVVDKLVEYVKNGGSVVIGGQFSNFISPDKFDPFIKKFGVSWKWGSYFRTTFTANAANELVKRNPSLPQSYSMKTVHLSNISPEMSVYRATDDSRLTSMVWDPVLVNQFSSGEAPAVCARVGKGLLSFLGDVNGEKKSTPVVLAMMGLLDKSNVLPEEKASHTSNVSQPAASTSSQPIASGSGQSQASTNTQTKKPMNKSPTAPKVMPRAHPQPSPDPKPVEQKPLFEYKGPARTKFFSAQGSVQVATEENKQAIEPLEKITDKFVLVLMLDPQSAFKDDFEKQLTALEDRIVVIFASEADEALEFLAEPNLQGVYVVDSGIAERENDVVVTTLAQYVRAGGQVVFGGVYPTDTDSNDVQRIFGRLDVPWRVGSYCKSEAQLNGHHETAARNPTLKAAYYMKAVHLRGFHAESMLHQQWFKEYETHTHFEPPGGDEWESAVLRQRVGKGNIGYIGDVGPEEESTNVILAMLELLTPIRPLEPDSSKFMLILSGFGESEFRKYAPDFLNDIKTKVEVHFGINGLSKARVIDLLPSRDLVGVLVIDTELLEPENAYLLKKIVEYAKSGGSLVFGWQFCKRVTLTQFRPLFRDNFGLDWDMIGINLPTVSAKPNGDNILFKRQGGEKLCKTISIQCIQIKGVENSMAVYRPTKKELWRPEQNILQASILYTPIEKGFLGYIGAATLDGDIQPILYSMLGLL